MIRSFSTRVALALSLAVLAASPVVRAADETPEDTHAEIQALKTRIAELEKKEGENWLTQERADQIKQIVTEAIADAKTHGTFGDVQAGYNNGFYIQSADGNNKLVIGGYVQVRYAFAQNDFKNNIGKSDPTNANGFELRRARINFSGNVFSKDIFFKLEGDFAGPSSDAANNENFQLTDAYIGYSFSDSYKIRAGSFKAPFAKAELTSDPVLDFMERPEVLLPFDPVRVIGVSLFGDVIKDKVSYEVNANDGSKSNTSGRIDDTAGALDNRLGFYGRVQWAGAGKISEFADEADLRKDPSDFIWMLGAAGGYESQNSTTNAYPHGQSTLALNGLSTADSPGFLAGQNLNGDIFRATADWSGKYQGWSFITSGYFQQINQNPGTFATTGTTTVSGSTVATSGTTTTIPGYGANDSSFFQAGYYGQTGYLLPQKVGPGRLEFVGRAGQLLTEGYPNRSEYYSIGANYYLFGQGAKIQSDITYVPNEAAYTDAASDQLRNAQELIYRVQLQVKF